MAIDTTLPSRTPILGIALATVAALLAALSVGPLLDLPLPSLVLGFAAAGLVCATVAHPPLAAYLLIATTPLIVGLGRGSLLPLVRPNEALALLLAGALLLRGLGRSVTLRQLPRVQVTTLDVALAVMALFSSVIPLLWMAARGEVITLDDALYALTLWKFFGVYVLIRWSTRTERQVSVCLWLSLGVAALLAVLGILQSLQLFGLPDLMGQYYAPIEEASDGFTDVNRATTTLASSIAMGDVMTYNLAIALGWLIRRGRPRAVLVLAATLFVFGAVASGQFSGAIALVVGILSVGLITSTLPRVAGTLLPTTLIAGLALEPVIMRRIEGFDNPTGLPRSWTGRLANLRTFFWPELTEDYNFLLGVRTSARVRVFDGWRSYVWIESGHTWLLWNGGIPLLLAFFAFLVVALRTTARVARQRVDAIGVAGVASFASLVVLAVLMVLDVHLTLRGSADLLFTLLALATVGGTTAGPPRS